jgi:hypothetical protein
MSQKRDIGHPALTTMRQSFVLLEDEVEGSIGAENYTARLAIRYEIALPMTINMN